MSRSLRSLNRRWEYLNSPTIHVASDGTIIAGCLTSYHTGDSLEAGRSKSALLSIHASEQDGQKRDIPEDTIFAIYKETVENLGPDTWSLIQQNKYHGKAFETAFKSRAQRYIDTGLPPDTRSRTARTKKLKLLIGSKLLPSCSATALIPVRSYIDDPSLSPQANIVWKSVNEIDHVKVGLPCSIKTLGVYHVPPSLLNVLSQAEPRTVPMTFTGNSNWWKEDIVAGSEAHLKPSLGFELSRVAKLAHGTTRDPVQADVEKNIASLFGAYLERNIKITASVARDLEIQRKDHPRLREMSEWRMEDVPGKPSILLEMQPVEGQEHPVPGDVLVKEPGRDFDQT